MEFYIGQIIAGGWNFAPRGTAFCNGQLLQISQYTALFSLIGTTYGGDGRTTFALPDLRSRVPMHFGHGSGLSNRPLGQQGGAETNRLTEGQLPPHNHGLATGSVTIPVSTEDADQDEANGHFLANGQFYHAAADGTYGNGAVPLAGNTANTGSGQEVNNMQPYLVCNYVIVLEGIFPSRS